MVKPDGVHLCCKGWGVFTGAYIRILKAIMRKYVHRLYELDTTHATWYVLAHDSFHS